MQRGESADTTWSVGKKGTKLRPKLLPGVDFPVKVFHWHQSEGDDPTTKASTAPSQPPPKGKSPLPSSPQGGGELRRCFTLRAEEVSPLTPWLRRVFMSKEYMEIPHP